MRKQFPACKKIEDSLCRGSSRHHKHKELSASASIPQRKEEGARAKLRPILDSVRINTSAGLRPTLGSLPLRPHAKHGWHDRPHSTVAITRSKWPPAFAHSHWRRQDVAHADVKQVCLMRVLTFHSSACGARDCYAERSVSRFDDGRTDANI